MKRSFENAAGRAILAHTRYASRNRGRGFVMNAFRGNGRRFLLCMLCTLGYAIRAYSQAPGAAVDTGAHDFDFDVGTWKTHVSRLQHPLTGSTTWIQYEGTSIIRKIWNGRANMVELEADSPAGHIEALSLRLYNPQSHQWSLNFSNSAGGTMGLPTIGEFKNGRGVFTDQETLNDRAILVRFVISDITPVSVRYEQSFSDDGGKTWEINWIATDTRDAPGK
jgi:hypothetical protein